MSDDSDGHARSGRFVRLGGELLVYGIGQAAVDVMAVLLLPVYTRVFTPAEYGVVDVIHTLSSLSILLVSMGVSHAVLAFYFRLPDAHERKRTIVSAAVYFLAAGVLFVLPGAVAASWLAKRLFGSAAYGTPLRLAIFAVPLSLWVAFNQDILRFQRRPFAYVLFSTLHAASLYLLLFLLVVMFRRGVAGVFVAILVGRILFACVALWLNREVYHWESYAASRWRALMRYGAPLVLAGLNFWAMSHLARYALLRYATLHEVGLYAVGTRLASVVGFAVAAFHTAGVPFLFATASAPDARSVQARTLSYYLWVGCFLCAAIALMAEPILRLMASARYLPAAIVIPVEAFAVLTAGLHSLTGFGLLCVQATITFGRLTAFGMALNAAALWILVPRYGILGAAWSKLFAYAAVAGLLLRAAQKRHPVPYRTKEILWTLGLTVSVLLLRSRLSVRNTWMSMAIGCALLVTLAFLLWISPAVGPANRAMAKIAARKLADRMRRYIHPSQTAENDVSSQTPQQPGDA